MRRDSAGGGVGMLEVIEFDFARLEADTKASEPLPQKEYDEFTTDSQVDKTKKAIYIEHKAAKKKDEEQALTTKRSNLEGTQKELDAALAYFDSSSHLASMLPSKICRSMMLTPPSS